MVVTILPWQERVLVKNVNVLTCKSVLDWGGISSVWFESYLGVTWSHTYIIEAVTIVLGLFDKECRWSLDEDQQLRITWRCVFVWHRVMHVYLYDIVVNSWGKTGLHVLGQSLRAFGKPKIKNILVFHKLTSHYSTFLCLIKIFISKNYMNDSWNNVNLRWWTTINLRGQQVQA